MKKTSSSRTATGFHAFVLIVMSIITVNAIAPWNAWKVAPEAYDYGWNRFSFFTVQSNLIAATTYIMAAVAFLRHKGTPSWFHHLRGAAVLYMLVTGIIFALLLKDAAVNPTPGKFNWSNFVLHELGPLFIVIWWLLYPSKRPVSSWESLCWLIFPLLWTIFTFVRAVYTGWYPYPFLNPTTTGGVTGVFLYIIGIAGLMVAICLIIAWITRVRTQSLHAE
ncbi:hypothetical protein E2P86_03825 [Sphingobacterium psychroaquaticum]|uniref:Pr6Pr family membrane protein n=1 Tax=Sphingobacterium psychroaquaticum TaxID=561061 RepID=UPI00106D0429|nr:Pr6Pr family membrane protein [Sphingobacterium psychroaquaticum]QBQ40322.1 hypothetical protein E2P86_03825 [Sphingobacterium psychroaquaticum]